MVLSSHAHAIRKKLAPTASPFSAFSSSCTAVELLLFACGETPQLVNTALFTLVLCLIDATHALSAAL